MVSVSTAWQPLSWVWPSLLGCASFFIVLFIRSVTEYVCARVENRAWNPATVWCYYRQVFIAFLSYSYTSSHEPYLREAVIRKWQKQGRANVRLLFWSQISAHFPNPCPPRPVSLEACVRMSVRVCSSQGCWLVCFASWSACLWQADRLFWRNIAV